MLREILILKHIAIEGPGSMEDFFGNTTWNLRIIDLSREKLAVEDFSRLAAIISLGGPMNVYQENKYPFLREENELLKKALKEEIPILGICLGAQLLAKACGAKVKKTKKEEIGWYRVNLTPEGRRDLLFENFTSELDIFQWHQDSFQIPAGGLHLAESPACANQAFRFGGNAYGLQFHIEVTPEMVESWIDRYTKKDCRDMVIESYKKKEVLRKQAEIIYFNFSRLISESRKQAGH